MGEPTTVREWTDILRRTRLDGVVPRVSGATIKLIALTMASYADADGTRIFPGVARIAVDAEVTHQTAKRALAALRTLGLLDLVKAGARPGHADEYRLAIPTDLLDRVDVWSPAAHRLEVERLRGNTRGRYRPKGTGEPDPDPHLRVTHSPADSPDLRVNGSPADTDLRVTQSPADTPLPPRPAGESVTRKPGPAGESVTDLRVTDSPPTSHDLDTSTTSQPHRDLRTDVTAPRTRPPQDPISPEVEDRSTPPASRCPHGLTPGTRPDGQPLCALCRRATTHPPEPVEPGARVIQLRPRTA